MQALPGSPASAWPPAQRPGTRAVGGSASADAHGIAELGDTI